MGHQSRSNIVRAVSRLFSLAPIRRNRTGYLGNGNVEYFYIRWLKKLLLAFSRVTWYIDGVFVVVFLVALLDNRAVPDLDKSDNDHRDKHKVKEEAYKESRNFGPQWLAGSKGKKKKKGMPVSRMEGLFTSRTLPRFPYFAENFTYKVGRVDLKTSTEHPTAQYKEYTCQDTRDDRGADERDIIWAPCFVDGGGRLPRGLDRVKDIEAVIDGVIVDTKTKDHFGVVQEGSRGKGPREGLVGGRLRDRPCPRARVQDGCHICRVVFCR